MKTQDIDVRWLATMPALVFTGERGAIRVVVADPNVRVIRVDATRLAKADPLTRKGKPYPPRRAARTLLKMGRAFGITKAAKRLLSEVK